VAGDCPGKGLRAILRRMPRKPTLPRREVYAEELTVRFARTFPADLGTMNEVIDEIMKVVVDFGCAVDKEFEVELALREALTNAVLHGCRLDARKEIDVWVACADSVGVLIVVRDPGRGFDPASIPNPVVGENIYSHHGRGIYLINQLMDEVRFERGGTEIHMLKRS
jgi:serine/threonine-protein kinase RsbW